MQLAKSTVEQTFLRQVHALDDAINDALGTQIDYEALDAAQKKLDVLATRYQHSDTIGSSAYRLYELQALLHYYNGNLDDALDFIEQAIEVRGKKYERATRLLEMIQSSDELVAGVNTTVGKPAVSQADREVLTAKSSISSAGFWSLAIGILGTLVALMLMFVGPSLLPFSVILGAACVYFTVAGSLLTTRRDDGVLKGLLITNLVVSGLFVWTLLPIFILVTSAFALHYLVKLKGAFEQRVQAHDEILDHARAYQDAQSVFFHRSPIAVAIYTVITLGFYPLYWVYKHYALIRTSTQEKRTRYCLRSFKSLLFTL
jgi:tetratricopeptide (TPR) repeat protein